MSEHQKSIQFYTEGLTRVIDEYTYWFFGVLKKAAYPRETIKRSLALPDSYPEWEKEAARNNVMDKKTKGSLARVHKKLLKQAKKVLDNVEKYGEQPAYWVFDELTRLYDDFISQARALERALLMTNDEGQTLASFKTAGEMEADLEHEMSRLARKGQSFCLALLRIDQLGDIKEELGEAAAEECVVLVARLVQDSIRPFDDIYRLDHEHLIVSLKQTDMAGGVRALERLKSGLEKKNKHYKLGKEQVALSLSSCIAQPVAGDDVAVLLEDLKSDVGSLDTTGGTVLEYVEVSPLQRYARTMQE